MKKFLISTFLCATCLSFCADVKGMEQFYDAIYRGNTEQVCLILTHKYPEYGSIDVNQADEHGVTPLMYAVQSGNKEILKLLKTRGAGFTKDGKRIPQKDDEGNTLVYYAIKYGIESERKYTRWGYNHWSDEFYYDHDMSDDEDAYDDRGNEGKSNTEDMHITKSGKDMLKYLYKNDFITKDDLNLPYYRGKSLLIDACTEGDIDLLRFLLNINKNEDGSYSLPNINSPSNDKYPLLEVISRGDVAMAKLLLKDSKIEVNHIDNHVSYPLFYAIKKDQAEIVRLLLQHKDIKLDITENRHTPLQEASRCNCFECMQFLLEMPRIELDKTNPNGDTALHIAAWRNNTNAIKLLLEAGANVNAENKQGNTPILEAIDSYDINKGTDGNPPFGGVLFSKLMSTLRCFMQYYSSKGLSLPSKAKIQDKLNSVIKGEKAIFQVIGLNSPEIMSTFFDLFPNVDVNAKLKVGKIEMTPLHFAVYHGYIKGLKFLLKVPNIELNEIESRGNTALHVAVWKCDIDAITLLLEAGADVNVKDGYGNTPVLKVIHDCCLYNRGRIDTVISMLKCFIKYYNKKGLSLPSKDTVQNMTSSRLMNIKEEQKQQILDLFPAE